MVTVGNSTSELENKILLAVAISVMLLLFKQLHIKFVFLNIYNTVIATFFSSKTCTHVRKFTSEYRTHIIRNYLLT